jgi:hypothetical protein
LFRRTHQPFGASEDYVTAPPLLMLQKLPLFDFILIDGRSRADCSAIASIVCREDGEVMIHDYERKNYQKSASYFKEGVVFRDNGVSTACFKKPILRISINSIP